MARTITLSDLRIDRIYINYEMQVVTVLFSLLDASSKVWVTNEATFFVTMPPQIPIYDVDGITIVGYEPYPDTWFQLPASYVSTLVGLRNDADTALTNRFLA